MSVIVPVAFGSARVRLALLAVALVALGGLIVVARTRLTDSVRAEAPAPAQEPAAVVAQSKPEGARVTSHVLTVSPRGFDPAEVRWPKGRIFLTVNNLSNVSELVLRLEREVGGRVKEMKLRSKKERSAGVLDLTPGDYLLTEANHPGWVCRIKVTPQ
jgi:hypothetical protein